MPDDDLGRQRLLLAKVWGESIKEFLDRWEEVTLGELIFNTGIWFKSEPRRDAHLALLYGFQRSNKRDYEVDGQTVTLHADPLKSPKYREAWARDLFSSASEYFESYHDVISLLAFLTSSGRPVKASDTKIKHMKDIL